MRRWLTSLLVFCCLATALPAAAQETDEARFVRLTRQLEADPARASAAEDRAWLVQWLEQTPTLTVTACDIAGISAGEGLPHGAELFMQILFGNAVHQIENPQQRTLPLTLQVAGVQSALRSYQAWLAKDPAARIARLDDLLLADKNGTLPSALAPSFDRQCSTDDALRTSAMNAPAPGLPQG